MNETIRKAHLALIDGDRDKVLEYLESAPNTVETRWLRAQSVLDEKQRLALLKEIAEEGHSEFSALAEKIFLRETDYQQKLDSPPDYQFWKKPSWKEKIRGFFKQKAWSLGLLATVLISGLLIVSLVLQSKSSQNNLSQEELVVQPTPLVTPSITALPFDKRPRINYAAGDFSVMRIENPTHRLVVAGNSDELTTPAIPAVGAEYMAIQYEFLCRKALCESPPEVPISLKLSDGNIVSYFSTDQPILAEFPAKARISKDQVYVGWLVFEIPNRAIPASLIFDAREDYDDPLLELILPK